MSIQVAPFQRNRACFPLDELRQHEGRWVAFSNDGARIIASAEDMSSLMTELARVGVNADDVVFERIELDDDVFLGAAELL